MPRLTDDPAAYRARGHQPLPGLLPAEVAEHFLAQLNTDLGGSGGRALDRFVTRGPLLAKPAVEVYGQQYRPLIGLLYGLTPRIAQAVGAAVLPTYAYFRIYQQGDICRVHTDRTACEHSLSLTLAYSDAKAWPLAVGTARVATPDGAVTAGFGAEAATAVAMMPGDAVLYQGVHHRHGRVVPNPNRWSAHIFLHWVEREGAYSDQAFDLPAQRRAGTA